MAITDIKILIDNEVVPEGYIKTNENLNAGREGKSLFLAYKKDDNQKDPQLCITGLDVIEGKGATAPAGWTKDPTDLNAGVAGDWLFLVYKKGGNEPLIEDIQIKILGSGEIILPQGYRRVLRDLNQGAGGSYIFLTYRQELFFDVNQLIPLQAANYRKNDFVAKVCGSAILGDKEYEINFDTGSWTLSIPYGCLDKTKLEMVEKDVKDCWKNNADKVKGEIALKSSDGKTTYSIHDYVFFARKNDDGTDAPCDREEIYGNAIMGAFPSVDTDSGLKSFPYALAEKYSDEKKLNLGFGIVTPADKSYLILGDDQKIKSYSTHWRTDIPMWRDEKKVSFCPEATPGFTIRLSFPDESAGDGKEKLNEIVVSDLKATIDTGAPDMTLRLGEKNPQENSPFSNYFTKEKAFFLNWGGAYKTDAKMIVGNCNVTVEFKDSSGQVSSYSFKVDQKANGVAVGTWDGAVPWEINETSKTRTRFNLGNTIYRHCPIFFYDIKNKSVGIMFGQKNA